MGVDIFPFPRQMGLKRRPCCSRSSFNKYVADLNGRSSIYTSLYSFDIIGDYNTVNIDRAWWDFDTTEEYDDLTVKKDVALLIDRLEGDVRLVATGRGFHVYQIFSRPVKGRSWASHLDRYERDMAQGLKSLDGVGYPEKLTRFPNTYNPKRSKWAVTINARDFALNPLEYEIPDKPKKDLLMLDPFRGIVNNNNCFDLVKWVADNPPKQIENRPKTIPVGLNTGTCALPDCLDKAIRLSNPPHHVRVALVQEMRRQLSFYAHPDTLSEEENAEITDTICDFIADLDWLDYKQAITRKYVADAVRKYEHAPNPLWYRKHNLCDGECWFCS